nr:hypothetical protein [Streptomyces sp. DSM 41633]
MPLAAVLVEMAGQLTGTAADAPLAALRAPPVLELVADTYRDHVPDLGRRLERAARALGLDPAGLPSDATALARLVEPSRGRWRRPVLSSGTRAIRWPLLDATSGQP